MRKGLLALLPLAALLSACWMSSTELISEAAADTPSGVVGSYLFTETGAAPRTVRIDIKPGRYYSLSGTSKEGVDYTNQLRFDHIKGPWYLVHSLGDGSDERYYYRLLKVADRRIDEFDPGCSARDLSFAGVTDDAGDCDFKQYQGLRDAAQARVALYENGDVDSMSLTGSYTR
jgi:hypothetical protein